MLVSRDERGTGMRTRYGEDGGGGRRALLHTLWESGA